MSKFDLANLQQYEQIFGREKIQTLWAEFVSDATAKTAEVESRDRESQRLAYHSLRSSSQVFGMSAFAQVCTQREEQILAGTEVSQSEAESDRKLLAESMAEVERYLA